MRWRILAATAAAISVSLTLALPAGALSKGQLKAKALSLTDLPAGWAVDHSTGGGVTAAGCLKPLGAVPKSANRVAVAYTEGQFPDLQETLVSGPGSVARLRTYRHLLTKCTHLTLKSGGQTITATIRAVSFATGVTGSSTFTITFQVQGQEFGFEIVLLRIGSVVASVGYGNTGAPDPTQMQSFLSAAIVKIESA
jgi:hypothetical protein